MAKQNVSFALLSDRGSMRLSWLVILTSLCVAQLASAQITGYHDYTAVMDRLSQLKRSNPSITRLYSIGRSVEGRHLAVLQISRNANVSCCSYLD